MWSKEDIKSLMLLSGLIGVVIGTVGTATYVLLNELKNSNKKAK